MNEKLLNEARLIMSGFLKKRREELNLTQTDVANEVGISQDAIQRLEAGRYWPAMPTYLKWCSALGLFPTISTYEGDNLTSEALRSNWVSGPSLSKDKIKKLVQILEAKETKTKN
jgi:DNA-binding XRE family transcriptional regulator